MFKFLFFGIPAIALALWLWSLYWLRQWRYFLLFFSANTVALGLYLFATLSGSIGLGGHDEYGLGRIAAALFALIAHVVAVSIFTLWYRYHQQKTVFKSSI